ncbi:MAG: protein kinase [Vicinamibacteria bacterium]
MALATATRVGPFEVVSPLGAGGMGEVYRARDPRLARDVALKVLPERFATSATRLERLRREAKILASLNHPHIATLYGLEESDSGPVLVMELVEGETLAARLRRSPPSVPEALELARQIAEALESAHEKGILHRDLTPANVRLTEKGSVKLLDFGLARALEDAGSTPPPSYPSSLPTDAAPTSPPSGVAGTPPYMSPEQARGEGLDRRTDVWAFGCVLFEMLSGRRAFSGETPAEVVVAVLEKAPPWAALPESVPRAVRRLLERCLQKDREKRLRDVGDARLELEEMLLGWRRGGRLDDEPEERSPYPGLRFFSEADASCFFGREADVAALWQRISTRSLLAVIGPSGAGKTSFVRAGVIASRPAGWGALVSTPGSRPFGALAQALAPQLAGNAQAVADLLRIEEPEAALAAVSRWRRDHVQALLVVDQFEELFTLSAAEAQARFAELLGRIAAECDVHVLICLRDDFLIRCSEHAALAPVFTELTPLTALTREGLRRAVVEPAKRQGCAFEDDALAEEVVSAVEGVRGALPLVAFAVSRLWERRDRERKLLTRAAYGEIAGVEGALAQHAETTLDEIGPERQALVRELFRNLVTAQGTRAVIDRDELLSAFPDRNAAGTVLTQLVDARLLTTYEIESQDDETSRHAVEIVHESLLKAWPRLVRWQAQDADGALLRDQLKQAAHLWEQKGRPPDLLWSSTSYREFRLWRERYTGSLTAVEEGFAGAMVARATRLQRLRRIAVVAAMLALAGVSLTIAVSRREAVEQAQRAEASQLLALAQARLEADPTEALALTTASLELGDTAEAREFVMRVLWQAPPALELDGGGGSVKTPAFSPDGRLLAVAGHSEDILVWAENGRPVARLPGHLINPSGGNWVAWGPAGSLVVGRSGRAERLDVWALPRGEKIRTIDLGGPSWWGVEAGRLLTETIEHSTTGREEYRLRSWPLPDGEASLLGRVDPTALGMSMSWFAPNGMGWIYAKGPEVYLRELPMTKSARDRLLTRHGAAVRGMGPPGSPSHTRDTTGEIRLFAFPSSGPPHVETVRRPETAPAVIWPDPSGRWLKNSATAESRVRLWSRARWPQARPLDLRRNASWYNAQTTIDRAGDWIVASTSRFTSLTFWPLGRDHQTVVDGYSPIFRPVTFSPDGRWLATSWSDGQVRVWPLDTAAEGPRVIELPERQLWADVGFDPNGRFLFVTGNAGRAYVAPFDGSSPRRLEGFSGGMLLTSAAVSPSGRQVAAAFNYGEGQPTMRVWNLETGTVQVFGLPAGPSPPSRPGAPARTGYEGGVRNLRFADEQTVYTSGDGGIRRWDLRNGANELVLSAKPRHRYMMFPDEAQVAALVRDVEVDNLGRCSPMGIVELASGSLRPLTAFGECTYQAALRATPLGLVAAVGDHNGVVRVGRLSQSEPHLLVGHLGPVDFVAISPDLRWVASTGEDNTLRLWPMPDLGKPPLHTLPRDELITKLESLTNFRAARDPAARSGWKIAIGPFPGWKDVPTW